MSDLSYKESDSTPVYKMGNFATSFSAALLVTGVHTLVDRGELTELIGQALGIKTDTFTGYSLILSAQTVGAMGASFIAAYAAGLAAPPLAHFIADEMHVHREHVRPFVDFSRGFATVIAAGLVALNLNTSGMRSIEGIYSNAKSQLLHHLTSPRPAPPSVSNPRSAALCTPCATPS